MEVEKLLIYHFSRSDGPVINFDQLLIYRLCSLSQIQKYIETMDLAFYQVIIEVLIPDVLRSTLTRRFYK